jgi:hypothetical protein
LKQSKGESTIENKLRGRVTSHVAKLMLKLPWPRTQQQQEEERIIMLAALSSFSEGG